MAISAGAMSRRNPRGRERHKPMSEINVTPMVDVMLVLLIVFMVTAPLLTVGVQVDLPKTNASLLKDPIEPLAISVDAQGRIFLQDKEVELAILAPRLIAITGANPGIRIFIRADRAIDYGRVLEVMGTVNAAGFNKVALVAELPGGVSATPARAAKAKSAETGEKSSP